MNRRERRKMERTIVGKKGKNSSIDYDMWLQQIKGNISVGSEIHKKNIKSNGK